MVLTVVAAQEMMENSGSASAGGEEGGATNSLMKIIEDLPENLGKILDSLKKLPIVGPILAPLLDMLKGPTQGS